MALSRREHIPLHSPQCLLLELRALSSGLVSPTMGSPLSTKPAEVK